MVKYIIRRLLSAVAVMLIVTFGMYLLVDLAIDPLEDLRLSTAPNKEALIQGRIDQLGLNIPSPIRYFSWLGGVGGCFIGRCDLGEAWRSGQPVTDILQGAIATSLQLVFAATVIAILLGVVVGLISALRQYTGFDYAITFFTFLMYSLPVFWVAVLLKQFGAIEFNNFLQSPAVNWPLLIVLSLVAGLFWMGAMGGSRRRRIINFVAGLAVTFLVLLFVFGSGWLQRPGFGIVGVVVITGGFAVLVTHLSTGLRNKRSLYAALTATATTGVVYYAMQWFFFYIAPNTLMIIGLAIVAILVGVLIGWAFGGPDRWQSARTAAIVTFIGSVLTFIDHIMQWWVPYTRMGQINGRPIATLGSAAPNLQGNYWIHAVDTYTHLILPSIALILISFATYTRYTRGSMLEVMNQDYIRTARAKGLSERTVIMRHALRNALLPLASVVPVDIMSIIGGAVITESVFGWSGVGKMFVDALRGAEINPVMAYILLTGIMAILANLVADFVYGILDPRIRVNA